MKKAETKSNIVLVGTYRPENEAWIRERRLYNLPLPVFVSRKERKDRKDGRAGAPPGGSRSVATALPFHKNINAVVLFAEGHPNFAFKAKFKDVVDGAWLKKKGYSLSVKPHGEMYALYELCGESTPAKLLGRKSAEVFVSSSRCPVVKIDEAFYSRPYPVTGGKSMPYVFDCLKPYFRKWKSATTFNPVQMDFFNDLAFTMSKNIPFPPPKNPRFTFIDLFAGIGGFRIAMQRCGGQCVFTSEFDSAAQKTYQANFGDMPSGDITKPETHDQIPEKFDVVCAGFPCQAFSLAGKRLGFKDIYKGMSRGTLFAEVVKICEKHRPKAVFCENVKGLYIHDKGNTFKVIKSEFEAIGYRFFYKILNSKDFGVPQHRERIYMVAFREDYAHEGFEFKFPGPTGCNKTLNDIRERNVSAKYYLSEVYVETLRRHRARHEAAGHGFGYVIRDWNGVSGAIVCGGMGRETNLLREENGTPKGLVPETHIKGKINAEGIRKMTPREWARLQGFPEEFKLVLSDVHLYKQFGNSVSIPVIEAISKRIIARIKAVDSKKQRGG